MSVEKRSVVIGMAEGYWKLLGEENKSRLLDAHPNVRVEIVSELERFAELASQADGIMILPNYTIPSNALEKGSRLRWLHSLRAGVDGILTPQLIAAEHITLTSTKGPHAPLIAEHMVLLMLALGRHMTAFVQDQAERRWGRDQQGNFLRTSTQMLGKTIAILGIGQIGQNLARICQAGLGMKVIGMSRTTRGNKHVDRYFDRSELHLALGEADVVALCLALTPSTEKIIGRAELDAMKPTALLINAARGGLIDEAALIEAMKAGIIGGAGLDAVTLEPLPEDSPLWDLPNTIVTPHISWFTDGVGGAMVGFWAENIRRFAENEPLLGSVDRHQGY